jgi:NAD(P)-dependent dehydrogenase (short-subunit alcohol dehydrogenase family)
MAEGGTIVNISSSTTGLMLPGYGVYDATKGAIEAMTHVIAKEFGRRGITVNAVSPGATETESYRTRKSREFLRALRRCRPSVGLAGRRRSLLWLRSSPVTVDTGSPRRTCG